MLRVVHERVYAYVVSVYKVKWCMCVKVLEKEMYLVLARKNAGV